MHALRRLPHVVVRFARRVVAHVVLARRRQARQVVVDGVGGGSGARQLIGAAKRQRRRTAERRAHHDHRSEDVGTHDGAPAGNARTHVVAHHRGQRSVTERQHQRHHVGHAIERPKRHQVIVKGHVRAAGAAIAAQVGREDVIARRGELRHHLAPAVGQLREPVDQQHRRPVAALETGFEHVHADAVDIVDQARANAGWQHLCIVRPRLPLLRAGRARERRMPTRRRRRDAHHTLHEPTTGGA